MEVMNRHLIERFDLFFSTASATLPTLIKDMALFYISEHSQNSEPLDVMISENLPGIIELCQLLDSGIDNLTSAKGKTS